MRTLPTMLVLGGDLADPSDEDVCVTDPNCSCQEHQHRDDVPGLQADEDPTVGVREVFKSIIGVVSECPSRTRWIC
jgi:hypothetical protein